MANLAKLQQGTIREPWAAVRICFWHIVAQGGILGVCSALVLPVGPQEHCLGCASFSALPLNSHNSSLSPAPSHAVGFTPSLFNSVSCLDILLRNLGFF